MAMTSSEPDRHAKCTVFLRNVPLDATDAGLRAHYEEAAGPVRSAFVVRPRAGDAAAGGRKGPRSAVAYVHFALAEDAQRAVACAASFMGRVLKAELALRKKHVGDAPVLAKKVTPAAPKARPGRVVEITLLPTDKTSGLDKKRLYKRLRKAGTVEDLELTPRASGAGMVARATFPTPADAAKAASKIEGHSIHGYAMSAAVLDAAPAVSACAKAHRLVVRNVPFRTNEDALRAVFARHGAVLEVSLPRKADGMLRGFAFVQMGTRAQAEAAMAAVNATEVCGRAVAVDWAVSKTAYAAAAESAADAAGELPKSESPVKRSNPAESAAGSRAGPAEETKESLSKRRRQQPAAASSTESHVGETGSAVSSGDADSVSGASVSDHGDTEEPVPTGSKNDSDSLGRTVFVRNVPYTADERALRILFGAFGAVEDVRLVRSESGEPRGSAFVRYASASSAVDAVAAGAAPETDAAPGPDGDDAPAWRRDLAAIGGKIDALAVRRTGRALGAAPEAALLEIDGRRLHVFPAVDKRAAEIQARRAERDRGFVDANGRDRRNLRLLSEALIAPKTPEAAALWRPEDAAHRKRVVAAVRRAVQKSPDGVVSTTRLSLRQLPRALDARGLKAVVAAAVRHGLRHVDAVLSDQPADVRALGAPPYVRQAKVVLDAADPAHPVSRGHGFVQMSGHGAALLALRVLTHWRPRLWREVARDAFAAEAGRRRGAQDEFRAAAPLVEFAVDKASVLARRAQRLST